MKSATCSNILSFLDQAASRTLKGSGSLLRGHQDHQRLVEVLRDVGEGRAVVRIHDQEERTAGERVQVTWVKTRKERSSEKEN